MGSILEVQTQVNLHWMLGQIVQFVPPTDTKKHCLESKTKINLKTYPHLSNGKVSHF